MEQSKGRSSLLPMLVLIKKNIVSAFETISKANVFKFRLDNDKVFYSYLAQVNQKIDRLTQVIVDLPKIEMKDSPASINIQTMGKETINKIVEELSGLRELVRQNRTVFPRIQEVRGQVELRGQQQIPYERMLFLLKSIEQRLGNIKIEFPQQKIEHIKTPEFPKELTIPEIAKVIDAIKELQDEIKTLPKKYPTPDFPEAMKVHVSNFPPQKYPMPVSNININPLRGEVKTRAITVTTALTPLPDEILSYRRSLTIYNNGSVTVFIGGSTMTTADGLPILAGTYGPALDAGPKMILYGRTSSGSSDVRVLEASNENIGA